MAPNQGPSVFPITLPTVLGDALKNPALFAGWRLSQGQGVSDCGETCALRFFGFAAHVEALASKPRISLNEVVVLVQQGDGFAKSRLSLFPGLSMD